jgi:hypothetical protein
VVTNGHICESGGYSRSMLDNPIVRRRSTRSNIERGCLAQIYPAAATEVCCRLAGVAELEPYIKLAVNEICNRAIRFQVRLFETYIGDCTLFRSSIRGFLLCWAGRLYISICGIEDI